MKRIFAVISAVLCIAMLNSCMAGEISADLSSESSQDSVPSSVKGTAEAEQSLPEQTQEESFFADKGYFALLDATYADLTAAYGEAEIFGNMEWGLYANFESSQIFCRLHNSKAESDYRSFDSWLLDENEFKFSDDGYADLYYYGEKYSGQDFKVTYISVFGDAPGTFFGNEEPVAMSMIGGHLGIEPKEIIHDEMYDTYTSEAIEYNGYLLSFDVTPSGNDYIVNTINIYRKNNTANNSETKLLAVFTNSSTDSYKSLSTPAKKLDASGLFEGLHTEAVLFAPLIDDVRILVEQVEYIPSLNHFITVNTLYDFDAKLGEHYELQTYLSESIPQVRITAIWNERQLSWDCTYDAVGDRDVVYLSFAEEDTPMFGDEDYIIPISAAAAAGYVMTENDFWYSVAYAVAMIEGSGGETVTLSQESFYHYVEAIHPGYTAWPELCDGIIYNERDNTYTVKLYSDANMPSLFFSHIEENDSGGSVWIAVEATDKDSLPILCEVVWEIDSKKEPGSSFYYHIADIIVSGTMG